MVHAQGPARQARGYNWAIIPLLIWILYFLVPSEGGLLDGIPVGPLEALGLLLVVWLAAHRVRIAGAWAAGVVTVAAVIAALAVPGEGGFYARYYASAVAGGAHERSIEQRDRDFTRVDTRLEFVRDRRDLPLAFFNDHARFNFMRMGEPDRRHLEFAAAWTGWLYVPAGGARRIYLDAPGATAQIAIDGQTQLSARPSAPAQQADVSLTEGWHRLHITLSSPYGGPRSFSAGEIDAGVLRPFSDGHVRTEQLDARQRLVSRIIGMVKPAADASALAWLAGLSALVLLRRAGEVWRPRASTYRAAIALFAAAGAVESLRFAWPWATRFRIMTAGDDTITYETYARDILFNGILMNGGALPGQGEPFYYQAFYPYFLAATHAVFGESFFGALLVQRLLVVLTAVTLTRIAVGLRGPQVWPFALAVSALFCWWKVAPISADMLNESLYVPLLAAWASAMIETCRQPAVGSGARAGIIGGLAAITRSTALLSWVLVWPLAFWQWRFTHGRAKILSALVACSLAVFSLIAIRNWIVSHQFVPTSTELGITLYGGNPPPADMVLDPSPRRAFYERFGMGGYTVDVIEYAIASPSAFAANMARKAVFALGFYEPYAEGWGYSPVFIATWISALFGVAILVRSDRRDLAMLVPLLIAVTQYLAVVIVYPKGERLILPVHTLLIPYSAVAVHALWVRLLGR
jgi:hypothetical protein